jgi:hypothetical protein
MKEQPRKYSGSCHCGKIRFELVTDLKPALRCNCSICKRKGVPMVTAEEGSFRILDGEDSLGLYQFHTGKARHYFCKNCGIYTFHNPRSNSAITRVNSGCLEGVDPLTLEITLIDGAALD